jgi:hypothetical protein
VDETAEGNAPEQDGAPKVGRRRALMLGAAGAGAGIAATVMGSASPALADDGSPVLLGESNTATSATVVTTSSGPGIQGIITVSGTGASGVCGTDQSTDGAVGMVGQSTAGVGVQAITDSGTALAVDGPVTFSRSGRATVVGHTGKSARSVLVTGVALASTSQVIVTPQHYVEGIAVAGVTPDVARGTFSIWLTDGIETSLPLAWFIIDLPAEDAPRANA